MDLYKDEELRQTLIDLIHTADDLDILDFQGPSYDNLNCERYWTNCIELFHLPSRILYYLNLRFMSMTFLANTSPSLSNRTFASIWARQSPCGPRLPRPPESTFRSTEKRRKLFEIGKRCEEIMTTAQVQPKFSLYISYGFVCLLHMYAAALLPSRRHAKHYSICYFCILPSFYWHFGLHNMYGWAHVFTTPKTRARAQIRYV
jgi:hypothetical protein